jgi:large subunit ribosomal protein L4
MLRSAMTSFLSQRVLRQFPGTISRSLASQATEVKKLPPNLKIHHRSSFSPQRVVTKPTRPVVVAAAQIDDDEVTEEKEKDANWAKEAKIEAEDYDGEEEEEEEEYDDEDEDDDDHLYFESPTNTPVIPLPDRLKVPVYHFGEPSDRPEEVGTMWLNPTVFGKDPIRIDLLKRAVDFYRAKKRGRRKAHTKRIGDIRGSGKKQRPQKGQGMARMGHKKAPHLRGGAKAHGPTNETNYGNIKLNKKVRRLALQNVLSQKLKEGNLLLVNHFHSLPSHKTKTLMEWLQPFGIAGRTGTTAFLMDSYFIDDNDPDKATSYHGVPINLRVASTNLHKVTVGNQKRDLKVYDVLKHEKLVLTLEALTGLEARLKDD